MYTQALTTIVPGTFSRLPNGLSHVQVQFAGDAGEPTIKKDFDYRTDEDLRAQAKTFRDQLNGVTVPSGVLGDPTPAPADPAGALRAWIGNMRKIAELERFRDDLTRRALNAGANAQASGGNITAAEVTNWNTLVTDLTLKIDALKEQCGTQYAGATAGQRQAGLDNL